MDDPKTKDEEKYYQSFIEIMIEKIKQKIKCSQISYFFKEIHSLI